MALKVRKALVKSIDPHALLFRELPEACGIEPFSADQEKNQNSYDLFFELLKTSLTELQVAYEELIGEITTKLFKSFNLEANQINNRAQLSDRVNKIIPFCMNLKLKAFLIRLSDDKLSTNTWIESIASILTNNTPNTWNDNDIDRFELKLFEFVEKFLNLEMLILKTQNLNEDTKENTSLMLSLTSLDGIEREKLLHISRSNNENINETLVHFRQYILENSLDSEDALTTITLLAKELLSE